MIAIVQYVLWVQINRFNFKNVNYLFFDSKCSYINLKRRINFFLALLKYLGIGGIK